MTEKPTYEDLVRKLKELEQELAKLKGGKEALHHEKELADGIINSLPGIFYMFDKEQFLRWNKKWETITGYSPAELGRMYGPDFFQGADKKHIAERMQEVFRDGASTAEAELVTKDGKKIPYYFNGLRVIFDDKPYLIGMGVDITERKQAEKAIIKERDFISKILQWIDSLVVVINIEGYIINFNRKSEQLSGYRFEEVQDRPFWDILLVPEERESVKATIKDVVHKELPKNFQNHWITKTGQKRLISWNNSVLRKTDGSIEYILCTGLDITERQKAETALKRSEAKYRELVQNANSIIARFDINGNFTFFNEYAEQFFGYKGFEIIGKNVVGTILPEIDTFGKELTHLISKITADPEQYITYENENILRNGQRVWVAWTNKVIRNQKGDITEILCIGNDITERKRLENQLQQSQRIESIGTLAAGIAHDFNNILFPILGYSEILKGDIPIDSPLQHYIDRILQAASRSKNLVNQILTFSRQSDQGIKPIKLQPIAREALKLLRSSIPTTISIQQDIDLTCGVVNADPTQIHQVIMNLVTNAYHAMENTGGRLKVNLKQIRIETEKLTFPVLTSGEYALLTVTDTGIGIEKDVLQRVFDPYFSTKEKSKGTGLGLSVVQGIVKSCSGDIRIYSEPGRGTVVRVYLPIIDRKVADLKIDGNEPILGGTEKILLVDDEEIIVRIEQEMLERLGYRVAIHTGSVDAFEAFSANPNSFDLVVTDMTMPNMTGVQLIGEIKKIRPEIPAILCTGYSHQISGENCKALGIGGFIMKPVVMREFAETIRKVLDNSEES